jgi:hypothetical protein
LRNAAPPYRVLRLLPMKTSPLVRSASGDAAAASVPMLGPRFFRRSVGYLTDSGN